jgi:hypothetical protein
MRPTLQQRALRILLSATLNADFTAEELQELSFDFTDGQLSKEFGRLLENISHQLKSGPYSAYPSDSHSSSESGAFDTITSRKLPKSYVLQAMARALGNTSWHPSPKASTRATLKEFFRIASEGAKVSFLNSIENYKYSDPYLKGIGDR